jgi:hypothetical protein
LALVSADELACEHVFVGKQFFCFF